MHARFAACAAWVLIYGAGSPAQAAGTLTLNEAFQHVADRHPELRLFGAQADVLSAERDRAALPPALTAGIGLENAFGSGEVHGTARAELTLTLASVLERGGKLDARKLLAQSRFDALGVEREIRRLDLLAEVARRYLAAVAAEQLSRIAALDMEQRQRTVEAARRRLKAGASPEAVVLSAEVGLARAELDRTRAQQRLDTARQHLAALWGEHHPDFEIAPAAGLLALPPIPVFDELAALLDRTPEIAAFADQRRIREARLQLARAEGSTDIDWQVGMRRLEDSGDFALVGTLSVPIGAARRARPEIRAAQAELTALEIERESKELSLYSTLVEAHGRYSNAQIEVARFREDILPRLDRANASAERAFGAGAISYLEWAQIQSEHTSSLRQQLEAALEAQRALIEIQRLTGQPFIAGATS